MTAPSKITVKQRLQIDRQKMSEQAPLVRNANFEEVNLGLPEKAALLEAERCLQCRDPRCVSGCPVMVNIPRFINLLSQGDMEGAAQSLLGDNALPSVTGRVCPQETQCEVECIRGHKGLPVAIGYLERYVGDWAKTRTTSASLALAPSSGWKVAVVGAGPGGLTAAGELARRGHDVTIYEALHKPGGAWFMAYPNSGSQRKSSKPRWPGSSRPASKLSATPSSAAPTRSRSCGLDSTPSSSPMAPVCRCS